jgi:TolA-binding protein
MNLSRIIIVALFVQFSFIGLQAQKSLIYTLPDQDYKTALELYEKQKYAAAQQFFQKVIDKPSTANTGIRADAEYYSAQCALELFNPDAEFLLTRFIARNPENNKANDAYFSMARHQYNNKKYNKATDWFEKVDISRLTSDQSAEYHFEAGYSYFMQENYDKARLQFYEIKDIDTKYTAPALYYYSHIAYQQKNYETALEGFLRLRDDETFAPIVPYYITQIYFLQKKYDKVVEYAPPLLDSVVEKRMGEMARMIGESYYRLGKYNESLPYLEKYAEKTASMTPEDRYQIAYAYYKAGDLQNAIRYFEPISNGNTALAQNVLYHLADCYLRTDNKQKARLAFSSAANMDFNADIKENSLFNYAVATYELSLSPFNEAVNAFNEYIKLYPYSNRSDQAYNYLVLAYMSTRNYQAALESIDKIKQKDNTIKRAYQRIAFFRGLELYNSLKFEDAADMFDKSLEFSIYDPILAARAYYWKGEAMYRLGSYKNAIDLYNKFLISPDAATLDEFELTNYNIAYSYFNLKDYDEALDYFRRYTGLMKDKKNRMVADSYNRMGDCYFMKASYWVAIENYEKAMNLGVTDADYSLFQKGFALGLVNRPEKKAAALSQLLQDFPQSAYDDDALYELGRVYVVLNSNNQAITSYTQLLNNYPKSSYVPKVLLNLGLIYYNTNRNKDAIASYQKVVDQYPGTPDSRDALNGLKTVYMDMNNVDAYFNYLESKGEKDNVRMSEQDSLTYTSAENIYMSGDCDKSSQQFSKYIQRFPSGSFLVNANYYLADCYLKNNKTDEALQDFEYVLSKPRSMFTEQALVNAASILYNKNDFTSALALYKRLEAEAEVKNNVMEAKIGQMRCNFKLNDFPNSIVSAKALLNTEKLPDEMIREARFILAKSYLETQDIPDATDELQFVAKDLKSAEGAESKYRLAKLYYDQDKLDLAEKEIFDFIKKNTPYQYWLGKSFLLLSDIYVDKKDNFQATQTLQSLIDYYEIPDDGIKAEAKEKKDKLTAKNAEQQVKEKQQDLELNMNDKKIE